MKGMSYEKNYKCVLGIYINCVHHGFIWYILPNAFETVTENLQQFITDYFSWYYLIIVSAIVLFCIFFMFNSAGTIKLAKHEDQPEYSTPTWLDRKSVV